MPKLPIRKLNLAVIIVLMSGNLTSSAMAALPFSVMEGNKAVQQQQQIEMQKQQIENQRLQNQQMQLQIQQQQRQQSQNAVPSHEIQKLNAVKACLNEVAADTRLSPLKSKIALNDPKDITFLMRANQEYPTSNERDLLLLWGEIGEKCWLESKEYYQSLPSPYYLVVAEATHSAQQSITVDLLQGKITYGEYARKRIQIANITNPAFGGIYTAMESRAPDANITAQQVASDAVKSLSQF